MNAPIPLSVVLPCYNAADTIGGQLEALAGQSWSRPWEVVVVDNRSTDDSMAIVERYRGRLPGLRIVKASARQGRAYALNTGAHAARGESIAFCDADDEVAPGWVAAIGDALGKADFVASRFDATKLNPPELQRVRETGQTNGLSRIWYPPYLPYAGGCGLGVKRSLWEAVNGFDEKLLHVQDADFCFKVQLAGAPLQFVPEALVHVRLRYSLGATFRQACNWAEYNVIIYKKYQPVTKTRVRNPWKRYAREWIRLGRDVCRMRNVTQFGACLWLFGWQIGRFIGSVESWTPPV